MELTSVWGRADVKEHALNEVNNNFKCVASHEANTRKRILEVAASNSYLRI